MSSKKKLSTLLIAFASFALCLNVKSVSGVDKTSSDDLRKKKDAITELVLADSKSVPRTPLEFLKKIKSAGLKVKYHIVANGGIQNTERGSFSCFGTVSGKLKDIQLSDQDFSFGIFIEPDKAKVLEVQNDFATKLLVEVIVKDFNSGQKDFWELIGEPANKTANWHFRTDSDGIFSDTAKLNMEMSPKVPAQQLFGNISRCSGCHTSGDMVMKELNGDHNDWMKAGEEKITRAIGKFSLVKGSDENSPKNVAYMMFQQALEPEDLAKTVRESLKYAVHNVAFAKSSHLTDKQRLRSLFAPLEMNIEADSVPFEARTKKDQPIEIPTEFFVDERITGVQPPIKVPAKLYAKVLTELGSSFAADETKGLLETQHAFLFPARSAADENTIDELIKQGKLDQKAELAILSVDWTTPMYSQKRLTLIEKLPDNISGPAALTQALQSELAGSDKSEDPKKNALELLSLCRSKANSPEHVKAWVKLAAQRRVEIQAAQTSQNKRGTILEGGLGPGGFRRIFPEYKTFKAIPYEFTLDAKTALIKPSVH